MKIKTKYAWLLPILIPIMITSKVQARNKIENNITRIWGKDRYETAVEISKVGWKAGANSAVIVSGENFPDALSASPFAKLKDAPIILTKKNNLSDEAFQELKRLNVNYVYIIGGEGVISKEVENKIKTNLSIGFERIYGKDRYETAVKVAEKFEKVNEIFITSGENYSDALSVGSIAAIKGAPIILTNKHSLPHCSKQYIDKNYNFINSGYIIGGIAAVSEDVQSDFSKFKRIAGLDRYNTNKKILESFSKDLDFHKVYLARADSIEEEFSDAITGSVIAAKEKSAVVILDKNIAESLGSFVKSKLSPASRISIFGGHSYIGDLEVNNIKVTAEVFDKPRETYAKDIYDNVYISGDEVLFKNLKIAGDLYIEANNVILSNVVVDGTIYISKVKGITTRFNNVAYNNLVGDFRKVEYISLEQGNKFNTSTGNDNSSKNSNHNGADKRPSEAPIEDNKNEDKVDEKTNYTEDKVENVTTSEAISLISLKLNQEVLELKTGDNIKLTYSIFPKDASKESVIWISENEEILEVTTEGAIKAKAPGKTRIVLMTEDRRLRTECMITINEALESEGFEVGKDVEELKKALEENKFNLSLETYSSLSLSAKQIVCDEIYENKDNIQNKENLQQKIDELLERGYRIRGNEAVLIEGIESNLSNAINNLKIDTIYMPIGVYNVVNTANINRKLKIQGEDKDKTKIELRLKGSDLPKVGFFVQKGGSLEIFKVAIDGLYSSEGRDIDYLIESQGTTILDGVIIENVGQHKSKISFGIRATGRDSTAVLKVDNSVFRNMQNTAIISSFANSIYIGTSKGNVFESNGSDSQVSAIVASSSGKSYIENNIITGYSSKSSYGIKLMGGAIYSVKSNFISSNKIGIITRDNIAINLGLGGGTKKALEKCNPECKGNTIDIEVVK